ncbi:MAG TPA: methyltransferase domain-containing protein [Solirubrobacteraceae bacterium]|nr:methyltransferase domain-containing protein [Solirubrobacteraceae bacterium]
MSELEDPRVRWNARYAAKGQELFERAPSEWVAEHRDVIVAHGPGRVVDVACGGGRNAVFLAEHGFDVDAVDVSDVAIDGVSAVARYRGLRITAARADVVLTPFPRPPYRVVLTMNFLRRELFGRLEDAVDDGGLLVFQSWMDHPRLAHPLQPGELPNAFASLEVLAYREDPGAMRAGIVARRPAAGGAPGHGVDSASP